MSPNVASAVCAQFTGSRLNICADAIRINICQVSPKNTETREDKCSGQNATSWYSSCKHRRLI